MAFKALAAGLLRVLSSPLLVAAAMVAMLLVTVPFAARRRIGIADRACRISSRSRATPARSIRNGGSSSASMPAAWPRHSRRRSSGLRAPLDNLSALVDGTRRPLVLLLPYLLAIVVWSFLWGAALERFAHGSSRCGFVSAGARTFLRFFIISVVAAVILVLLYVSIHPLLFGVLAPNLEASAATERTAFILRSASCICCSERC